MGLGFPTAIRGSVYAMERRIESVYSPLVQYAWHGDRRSDFLRLTEATRDSVCGA